MKKILGVQIKLYYRIHFYLFHTDAWRKISQKSFPVPIRWIPIIC